MIKRSEFSSFYPSVLLLFYTVVIVFTVVFFSPLYAVISLFAAFSFATAVKGRAAIRFALLGCLPTVIIFTVFNILFVHKGATAFLFLNSNPLTVESAVFGLTSGLVFSSVFLWCYTFNEVAGQDKTVSALGRILPQIALIITIVLRLIPMLRRNAAQISDAQTMIGKGGQGRNIFKKLRHGLSIMSVLITISLENGIITTNSMRARGYGRVRRRSCRRTPFKIKDMLMICFLIATVSIGIISLIINGKFVFYPVIVFHSLKIADTLTVIFFSAVCFFPCFYELLIKIRFNKRLRGLNTQELRVLKDLNI